MKKIAFYSLLLCASWGYAQDTAFADNETRMVTVIANTETDNPQKLLKKEDFNLTDGRMLVNAVPCKVSNKGITNTILVTVICQQKAFNQFGVEKINNMILVANEKVRSSLKVENNYLPKEIKMAYIPDSHDWSLTSSFTEESIDGIVTERLLALDFDANGKFAVMKRIL